MIKLIATDIDGTLLQNGDTHIHQDFFTQAERLMQKEIMLCAASGRQYHSLTQLFAPCADRMYFICENGAVVFGPNQKLISKTIIDRDLSLKLCREILSIEKCELLISGTNMSYLIPKTEAYENHIRYFVGNNVTILSSPDEMPEDFVKISAYYADGADMIEPLLKPQWQEHLSAAIAGKCWLDFTLADKSTGIHALYHALDLSPEQTMAFGDNYNDIPMLNSVGYPYLMRSAVEPLRMMYPSQCTRVEDVLRTLS